MGEVEDVSCPFHAGVDAGHEVAGTEFGEAAPPCLVHEVAPLPEITDAAHVGEAEMPVEHFGRVGPRQVAFRDDALGIPGLVREGLQPFRLVHGVRRIDGSLHVDRLGHVAEADFGQKILDAVALALQRVGVRQKAVHGVALQPAVAQPRVLQVVQVEVRVHEGDRSHVRCSSIIAPDHIWPIGLAMFCPAISGAEP